MKYTPHENRALLGTWELCRKDTVDGVKAAILAERQRRADELGRPLLRHETTFPTLELFRMPPGFKKPRPGKGELAPGKLVAAAMALCEQHGAEFWALGPRGRVWGVRDGRYVDVDQYGAREVDAWLGERWRRGLIAPPAALAA